MKILYNFTYESKRSDSILVLNIPKLRIDQIFNRIFIKIC
jgi:hypothetical protein